MDIRTMLSILWKRAWLIGLGTLLAAGLGVGLLLTGGTYPQYSATGIVAIGVDTPGASQDPVLVNMVQDMIPTYIRMVTLEPITTAVIESLELPDIPQDLGERISARVIGDTQLLEIQVTYPDPDMAAAIANEVIRQLISQASPRVRSLIVPVQTAQTPNLPDLTGVVPAIMVGVAGALFATGGVYLAEFIRHPLYNSHDVEEELGLSTLATLRPRRMVLFRRRQQANTEAATWWALTEAAQRQWKGSPDKKQWLLVTSLSTPRPPVEVALNLARTWAGRGETVLLADADLTHPLPEPSPTEEGEGDLHFLPAVAFTPETLANRAREASVVVIRAAPVPGSVATLALATRAALVLLVVEAGRVPAAKAREALELLQVSDAPIWGAVLCHCSRLLNLRLPKRLRR